MWKQEGPKAPDLQRAQSRAAAAFPFRNTMRRRCHGIHVVSETQATSSGALTGVGGFFAERAPAHTFLIDGVFGVGTFVSSASGKHAAVKDRDSADVTQEDATDWVGGEDYCRRSCS